jgi:hypothetical protein
MAKQLSHNMFSLYLIAMIALVALVALVGISFPLGGVNLVGFGGVMQQEVELHRYWLSGNDHAYAVNENHRMKLEDQGYVYEGVEALLSRSAQPGTEELFIIYNVQTEDHLLVTKEERKSMMQQSIAVKPGRKQAVLDTTVRQAKWRNVGKAGYIFTTQQQGTVALNAYYNKEIGDHFYTTAVPDKVPDAWEFESVRGFVLTEISGSLSCEAQGGTVCAKSELCLGAEIDSSDTGICCLGKCEMPPPPPSTCEDQGGVVCAGVCDGNIIVASDTKSCCLGDCTIGEPSCDAPLRLCDADQICDGSIVSLSALVTCCDGDCVALPGSYTYESYDEGDRLLEFSSGTTKIQTVVSALGDSQLVWNGVSYSIRVLDVADASSSITVDTDADGSSDVTIGQDASFTLTPASQQSCAALGGSECVSPNTCSQALVSASDTNYCCQGTCAPPQQLEETVAAPWKITLSSTGQDITLHFGEYGDTPVQGDYDGDGVTDLAVWRRYRYSGWNGHSSEWIIHLSASDTVETRSFGSALEYEKDWPVQADYDGDGLTDMAYFRQADNTWTIKRSSDGQVETREWDPWPPDQPFGGADDDFWYGWHGDWIPISAVPHAADYDGDGLADLIAFRPYKAQWKIQQSSDGEIVTLAFGKPGVKPDGENWQIFDLGAPGDYDGDGEAELAIRRPDEARFTVQNGANVIMEPKLSLPAIGDYDGDGIDDLAVFVKEPEMDLTYVTGDITAPGVTWELRESSPTMMEDDGTYWLVSCGESGHTYMSDAVYLAKSTTSPTQWLLAEGEDYHGWLPQLDDQSAGKHQSRV